ncbi:MAG: endonuclease [Bacilli bacterium]|jgi:endonuclease I|nr:endonuclease [Bacilli bacterium]
MNNLMFIWIPLVLSLAPVVRPATSFDGRAYATSTAMDFTDSSTSEVDSYYGDIGTKTAGNLMSYLYTVVSKDNTYVDYSSGVTKWYKITDRNWDLSRTITPETYKFSGDNDDNFRETLLYFKDNTTLAKAINTDVNGYTIDTSLSAVDWTNHKKPKEANAIQVDKEHVWVKSHGFSPSGDPVPGAGTDLHHLIAADHNTNNIHNNLYYGEVADHATATVVYCYYADGTKEVSGWKGKTAKGEDAFEPTDQWKGDVARALFYMGTRFSKELTTNTEAEPYLKLTDDNSLTDDNTNYHGVFHNLSTFLTWNELDPVDSYETHRNNLIYKNVQNNRNPYVDHPEWVRRVYDSAFVLDDGGGDFSKLATSYNCHVGDTVKLAVTLPTDSTKLKSVAFDDTILSKADDNVTFTAKKAGTSDITYTLTDKSGTETVYTTSVTVKDKVLLSYQGQGTVLTLKEGDTYDLKPSLANAFTDEILIYKVSDSSLLSVSATGLVTAKKAGSASVTIQLKSTDKIVDLETVAFTVTVDQKRLYLTIIIIAAVLLIAIILLFVILTHSHKKGSGNSRSGSYTKDYNRKGRKGGHRR